MPFCVPTEKVQYAGRLWVPGEKKQLQIGADEKPPKYFRVVGADPDADKAEEVDDGKTAAIKAALAQMDHKKDEQWTKAGLPVMAFIEAIIGDESITRAEVTAAFPGFCQDVQPLKNMNANSILNT